MLSEDDIAETVAEAAEVCIQSMFQSWRNISSKY